MRITTAITVALVSLGLAAPAQARTIAPSTQRTAILNAELPGNDHYTRELRGCATVWISTVNKNWALVAAWGPSYTHRCLIDIQGGDFGLVLKVDGKWLHVIDGGADAVALGAPTKLIPRKVWTDLYHTGP